MHLLFRTWWLLTCVIAQWNVAGSIHPTMMNRTSNGTAIHLPFRIGEMELGYSIGDIELITQSALEYRWNRDDAKYNLREAYLIWYPNWGEVKIGKQIHAWGAVDGNNPTDNLNPYDYYYMFLPGTDKKIGILSGSIKYYWDDWQLEAVVIPKHEGNRIPFDEPDFPISQSTEYYDPRDYMKSIPLEMEYGFNILKTIGNSDIGLTFFNGRDRSFTLGGYDEIIYFDTSIPFPHFSYRKTAMLGFDLVTFIGEMTFRGETAIFNTKNDLAYEYKNKLDATYVQFALQIEYMTEDDHIISAQLIGNEVLAVKGTVFEQGWGLHYFRDATEDDLSQGMGTPFAMFTDLGTMMSYTGNFWDNSLELRLNIFIDLKDSQQMVGCGLSYFPIENWEFEYGFSIFKGEEGTRFREMEDFSHTSIGLKFIF